jgi:aryl-alcohol dehydrogenase-like predicted oxidoreductase
MKRMGIDFIDMFMIHWPNPIEYVEEGWETLAELQKEGKVGVIGVSNFTVEQMEMIKPVHPIGFLEPPYSMLERNAENGLLDYCGKNNIGVITYSSLQQGLLTGTIKTIENFAPEDVRRRSAFFKEPAFAANVKFTEALAPIAAKYGRSLAQLAVAWILRRPEVTSAITGPRKPSEIEDNIKGGDWALSPEDIAVVEKLLVKRQEGLDALPK